VRTVNLTTANGGLTRLRDKGGAPNDSLYELWNGYVTQAGTIRIRPGTQEEVQLPAGTHGLCAFNGKLNVFSSGAGGSSGGLVEVHTINDPMDFGAGITRIHFAAGFLGYLYVVAEFTTGRVYHFWLYDWPAWQADKSYRVGDVVAPSSANGFLYRAHRNGDPNPLWAPGLQREPHDPPTHVEMVEPTEPNGFAYECTATTGAPARSGRTEPVWPTVADAEVVEAADADAEPPGTSPTYGPASPDDSGTMPLPGGGGRYDGMMALR
jgi:hypothetical protein